MTIVAIFHLTKDLNYQNN